MRIVLDAMGTDHAPASEVAGAVEALQELEQDIEVVLVGDSDAIDAELTKHGGGCDRLHVHHAADRVTAADAPASVLRRKPESSIAVGLKLFDLELDGTPRKALAQAGKTGWVYILDRTNGEPLLGIDEKEVLQEPRQKTAATSLRLP